MIIYNQYLKSALRRQFAPNCRSGTTIREEGMKALCCSILWIGLLVCGCASGYSGYYQEPSYGQGYYGRPYTSDVPPEFYNYDPSLSQWYAFPYWEPDEEP
jgi:hypothetical protein